jgi:hypothetical protein
MQQKDVTIAGVEAADRKMAHEQENPIREEQEALRVVLRRLGFEPDDEALAKLAPQVSAMLENRSGMAELDLSGIEPAPAFDARWRR